MLTQSIYCKRSSSKREFNKMAKKEMHIGFFIPSMRGGGAERIFVNLANGLSKKGFKVGLVLAQKEGPYLKDISNNVNIVDLKSSRIIKSLFPLTKYLKKESPDVLISTLTHVNLISIGAKIISKSSAKLLIRQAINYRIPSNKVRLVLERNLFKRADHVIAVSNGVKDSLVEKLGIPDKKIRVIYNPVFKQEIIDKSKESVNHPFFKENQKIILGVGRLSRQKDFTTLIKAFNRIKTDSIKLIILGEGRDREELEKLLTEMGLEKYVSMPGFVENPYAYMAKADVFVLSSKIEGFANVLVEALSCGTNIVSTDCPSSPDEILEGGKYGRLVPVGDVEKLAEAIIASLANPLDKEILLNRARMFSAERAVEEYIKIFYE